MLTLHSGQLGLNRTIQRIHPILIVSVYVQGTPTARAGCSPTDLDITGIFFVVPCAEHLHSDTGIVVNAVVGICIENINVNSVNSNNIRRKDFVIS